MVELDEFWHIGVEDNNWQQRIYEESENLFSISFTDGVYSGHILRLSDNELQVFACSISLLHTYIFLFAMKDRYPSVLSFCPRI